MDRETIHQLWTVEALTQVPYQGGFLWRVVVSYAEDGMSSPGFGVVHLPSIQGYPDGESQANPRPFWAPGGNVKEKTRNLLPGDKLWCNERYFRSWGCKEITLSHPKALENPLFRCEFPRVYSPEEIPWPCVLPPGE